MVDQCLLVTGNAGEPSATWESGRGEATLAPQLVQNCLRVFSISRIAQLAGRWGRSHQVPGSRRGALARVYYVLLILSFVSALANGSELRQLSSNTTGSRSCPAACAPCAVAPPAENLATKRAREIEAIKSALEADLTEPIGKPIQLSALGDLAAQVLARKELLLKEGNLHSQLESARQRARQDWLQAFSRLKSRLRIAGSSAQGWRDYLDLPTLEKLAGEPGPWPKEALEELYRRLGAGHPGLEIRAFADLRESTRRYLLRDEGLKDPQLPDRVAGVVDRLAEALRRYAEEASSQRRKEATQYWAWLEVLGLDQVVCPELANFFRAANLRAIASEELVQELIERPVDDTGPVYDVILGTELFGTGHTVGRLYARLVPNEKAGLLVIGIEGEIRTKATGYNGPVRVLTRGRTQIVAEKVVGLGGRRLESSPAYAEASTTSELDALWAVRGGRLVESIAWRRAITQKPLAEWIAARHAEERMNERFDREFDQRLAQWRQDLTRRFLDPLDDRGLMPAHLVWQSTSKFLAVEGWLAGRLGLTAETLPPDIGQESDLQLAVHESAVNYGLADSVAAMIVRELDLKRWAEATFKRVPAWMEVEDPAEPWTVRLANEAPIEVDFRDGKFRITLRGQTYQKGDRSYPGMDVTAIYRLEVGAAGPVAIREGDIAIYPPGFETGERRLSAREQVLRTLLERRFAKVFPPQWEAPTLQWERQIQGKEKKVELRPITWQANSGWLVIAWSLPGKNP
ncbi:MAG: hypothetical protein NZ899_14435 [Thermoguttaceae bacterium]|nr:hypothetical protein [Thermoguttaceae bacterium]MDW8077622.1 hypothetical protein [Thermoguttaceae bacterium]